MVDPWLVALLDSALGGTARRRLMAGLAAACVALPLAALTPGVTVQPAAPLELAPAGRLLPSLFNSVKTFESSKDGLGVKIQTQGNFALTDDWTGIVRLSRGAALRFEQDGAGGQRRLEVRPGNDGRPLYVWKVGGVERPFDAAGREWLRGMLLRFVRGTGYDAERRVAWLLERRGADGLLAEVAQIPGDFVKRLYLEQLFATRGLTADVLQRAIAQAGREMRSDHELSRSLLAAAGSPAINAPAGAVALLRSARGIGSDFELAELLIAFAAKRGLDDTAVLRAYGEAVGEIGSDSERRRTLSAAVQRGDLSPEALLTVLRSAREIGSSDDRATLLVEIAGRYSLTGATREAYLAAAGSIRSGYDRLRAEAALGRGRSAGQ
jgi:hypothetical protein